MADILRTHAIARALQRLCWLLTNRDIDSGEDLVDGGTAAGEAASKDYNDNRYHKPGDQYDAATWKLDGILAVLDSVYGVGERLANDDAWPNWYKTNPFRAARDRMMAAKSKQ